jgi:hypothetical protein
VRGGAPLCRGARSTARPGRAAGGCLLDSAISTPLCPQTWRTCPFLRCFAAAASPPPSPPPPPPLHRPSPQPPSGRITYDNV